MNKINTSIYIFLVLVRITISNKLPCFFLPETPHDDGWVLDKAKHILMGQWLGPYDHYIGHSKNLGNKQASKIGKKLN